MTFIIWFISSYNFSNFFINNFLSPFIVLIYRFHFSQYVSFLVKPSTLSLPNAHITVYYGFTNINFL